jgi:hypothetical protein
MTTSEKGGEMPLPTAESYDDVVECVRAFNEGLEEGEDLDGQLSYFRAWYYIPELDAVGPSKFIGYKGMTAGQYMRSEDLDGRVTEPVLGQWFDVLNEETPEAEYVERLAKELLSQYNKVLNRAARFSAPRGWKLHQEGVPVRRSIMQEGSQTQDMRPIVEVFWRAFLSLYPEDQAALAKRILKHVR